MRQRQIHTSSIAVNQLVEEGHTGADVDGRVEQIGPAQAKQVATGSRHDLHHTDGAGGADNMRLETGFDLRHRQRHARGDVCRLRGLLNNHLLEPVLRHMVPEGRSTAIHVLGGVWLRLHAGGMAEAAYQGQYDDYQHFCHDGIHWLTSRPMPAIRACQSGVNSAISSLRSGYWR